LNTRKPPEEIVRNWTEEEIALRNLRIFGVADPDARPERPAGDVRETVIEAECCKLLAQDGWRILKTDPVSDRGRGKGFGELPALLADSRHLFSKAVSM
jgi:hypothetical protein